MAEPNDNELLDENVDENLEYQEEVVNEEVVETEPEELTEAQVEKLLKLSDDKLKKYGIDDPKAWRSYQKLVGRKEKEWNQREQMYQQQLTQQMAQFGQLKAEIDTIKTPVQKEPELVKPAPPQMPQRPQGFNWADAGIDGSVSKDYLDQKDEYDRKQYEYITALDHYTTHTINRATTETKAILERDSKKSELEQTKAVAVAELMKSGLTFQQAQDCWNEAGKQEFYNPANIAELYKLRKGIKKQDNRSQQFDKRNQRNNNNLPPGIGGGGAGQSSSRNQYSHKVKDSTDWYKTKDK